MNATITRGAQAQADVADLLRSRHTLLWITSLEEARVERALVEAAALARFAKVAIWDTDRGVVEAGQTTTNDQSTKDPSGAIRWLEGESGGRGASGRTVLVMRDLHQWVRDPSILRQLRNAHRRMQSLPPSQARAIIVLTPSAEIPPDLRGCATVVDWPLPDRAEIQALLTDQLGALREGSEGRNLTGDALELAVDSAVGLSEEEATNCFALSLVKSKVVDPNSVSKEKKRIISRIAGLSWHDPDPRGLAAVGGLDQLKSWLTTRRSAFSPKAKAYGLPTPKGCMIVGIPGCLDGNTKLTYLRAKRAGGREITLRDLHAKFNGLKTSTRPWRDVSEPTYLHSLSPDGDVFYNRIVSVIEAGVKPTIRVDFSDGSHLRLTSDHPIATPAGPFVPAGELVVGTAVLARGSMKPRKHGGKQPSRPTREIVNVKHHPHGAYKAVTSNGVTYEYTRVPRARLVVEAHMNHLSVDALIAILQTNKARAKALKYLPKGSDVHHIDENPANDRLDNLMIMTHADHARLHAKKENLDVEYTREVTVTGTTRMGAVMTYDIQMATPGNNFVANGIIVHNTGKSLTAKALAAAWQVPLIRWDVGAMRSKYVGDSEANVRRVIQILESLGQCVLWLDEIEKALAGSIGPQGDGGVASDALGTILSWMQERTCPVFVVATANDVRALPPELLRKGRFDEVWWVDLPTHAERVAIAKASLAQFNRTLTDDELADVAVATDGFVGAEIAAVIPDALFAAFADGERALTAADVVTAARAITPLSETAREKIEDLRKWATGRARLASTAEAAQATNGRRTLDI